MFYRRSNSLILSGPSSAASTYRHPYNINHLHFISFSQSWILLLAMHDLRVIPRRRRMASLTMTLVRDLSLAPAGGGGGSFLNHLSFISLEPSIHGRTECDGVDQGCEGLRCARPLLWSRPCQRISSLRGVLYTDHKISI